MPAFGYKRSSLIYENDGSDDHAIPVSDVQRHSAEEHVFLFERSVNVKKLFVDWNASGQEGLVDWGDLPQP